jgi:membrane protein DedA with SNARE-associated domain
VLAGAAGLLFGTAVGFPIALIATTLTAVAQMTISRHTAGGQIGALVPERARRIDAAIERRGFVAVLYMRLAPGVPYHLVNYGAGLTRLRTRDMALGTVVGALPRTFAYVALGGSLGNLGSPKAIAAVILLVGAGAVGLWLSRREIVTGVRRGVRTLGAMDYYRFVRIYSAAECVLFVSLLVVWIGDLSPDARLVLGWAHGFGWIFLCLLVLYGWARRIFPGWLLAATVSPLGPAGALVGFEVLRHHGSRELVS